MTANLRQPAQSATFNIRFDGRDILKVPRPLDEQEFIDFCMENSNMHIEQDKHGNISIMSPVSYLSGNYESVVSGQLYIWNHKYKLGKTFSSSTMFILPSGEKRMPDAAWVSLEKHATISKRMRKSIAKVVPDFIVEIRSPSDRLKDLKIKMTDVWMDAGVRLAWLIDPEEKKCWVYQIGHEPEEINGFNKMLLGYDVLPGFEFDLSLLEE